MASKLEIVQQLTTLGVDHDPKSTKAELETLLGEHSTEVETDKDGNERLLHFKKPNPDIVGNVYDCPSCGGTELPQSSHSALCVKCTGDDQIKVFDTTRR